MDGSAAWGFVRDYFDIISAVGTVVASVLHSQSQSRSRLQLVLVWLIVVFALVSIAPALIAPQSIPITFRKLVVALVFYAAALYAVICDGLRFGLAARLTKRRGEKWVKELDYVYLTLGALGIAGSINKLEPVAGGHFTSLDFVGPLVLTTALVVRLVKTRAEIAGWNKL